MRPRCGVPDYVLNPIAGQSFSYRHRPGRGAGAWQARERPDRRRAFRAERAEVLAFCDSLAPADWRMNSRAPGGASPTSSRTWEWGCHAMFGLSALAIMRGDDIERTNDAMVAAGRGPSAAEVLAEYRRWSRVFGAVIRLAHGRRWGRIQIPLAELGRFQRAPAAQWAGIRPPHPSSPRYGPPHWSSCPGDRRQPDGCGARVDDGGAGQPGERGRTGVARPPLALTLTGPGGGRGGSRPPVR